MHIPTNGHEQGDISNDELLSNTSYFIASNPKVTTKSKNEEIVGNTKTESVNEEHQQQGQIERSNGDESNESENHDERKHMFDNVLNNEPNLYDEHQEGQQEMDTNNVDEYIDEISTVENLYDHADKCVDQRNQSIITDPFQFALTNVKVTGKFTL